jgi:hypothetical protein
MSEWRYIGAAYFLTWATFVTYGIYLARRRARAIDAFEAGPREQERPQ